MRILSIKDIIEFRYISDKSKLKFSSNIKLNSEKINGERGGDYWVTSLSAIKNSYKHNDSQYISDKIYELERKLEKTEYDRTKIMYKRNIDILYKFEDYDFKKLKPSKKITYLKKHNSDSQLIIKGLHIQASPDHVFIYKNNDVTEIGAIWFIAKLGGYIKDELGMFADILYRYLGNNISKDYVLNPKYCIAVDVVNKFDVNYSQIIKKEIPATLITTIDEIKRFMK
jgi:hypothetical protein